MNSESKSDNWQTMAPELVRMEKTNPYRVPEGYFESLSSRILNRIENLEEDKKDKSALRIIPVWIKYGVAACLTLALGISLYLNLNQNTINLSGISDEDIAYYLETQMDDSDAEFIFENLSENQKNIKIQNFSEEDLEIYLNQNL